MENIQTISKVSFEDIQENIRNPYAYIIHTLPEHNEGCLIKTTLTAQQEVALMNKLLKKGTSQPIIVYGMNANDESAYKKYVELKNLGFKNASLYPGGLFEWLLLQDIYGDENFPTSKKELDLLKYRAPTQRILTGRQQLSLLTSG